MSPEQWRAEALAVTGGAAWVCWRPSAILSGEEHTLRLDSLCGARQLHLRMRSSDLTLRAYRAGRLANEWIYTGATEIDPRALGAALRTWLDAGDDAPLLVLDKVTP